MRRMAFILLVFLAFTEFVDAQSFYSRRRDRLWMFSFGIGGAHHNGDMFDITYDELGPSLGPSLGVGLRRKLGSQLSIRLDANWYQMGGDDKLTGLFQGRRSQDRTGRRFELRDTRYVRNLNFRARNWEISAKAIFNFIPVDGSYTRRPLINPYLMVGLSRTLSRPKTYLPGEEGNYTVNLWEIRTEEAGIYPNWFTVIPVGIGIRLKANQYIDILLEGARRFTFTYYLDDVATVYPSREQIIEWNGGENSPTANIALQVYNRTLDLIPELQAQGRQEAINTVVQDFGPNGPSFRKPGDTRGLENNDSYYIFQIRLELYLPDNFLSELFSPSRRKPKFR